MWGAALGVACTILIAILSAAWLLSGRISKVESKLESLDNNMEARLKSAVLEHQVHCPAIKHLQQEGTNPRIRIDAQS